MTLFQVSELLWFTQIVLWTNYPDSSLNNYHIWSYGYCNLPPPKKNWLGCHQFHHLSWQNRVAMTSCCACWSGTWPPAWPWPCTWELRSMFKPFIYDWLVVWNHGILWLSIYWECHHPNWRNSIIFQRGRSTTNQMNIEVFSLFTS